MESQATFQQRRMLVIKLKIETQRSVLKYNNNTDMINIIIIIMYFNRASYSYTLYSAIDYIVTKDILPVARVPKIRKLVIRKMKNVDNDNVTLFLVFSITFTAQIMWAYVVLINNALVARMIMK